MLRFRLRSDHGPVSLFARPTAPDAFLVESGQIVDVPGSVVTEPRGDGPVPDDAYLVVHGDDERLWPKSVWELVEDKPAAPAATLKEK